jgi:hypothetical protein
MATERARRAAPEPTYQPAAAEPHRSTRSTEHARDWLDPFRPAGNRAIAAMLQRQEAEVDETPTDEDAADGIEIEAAPLLDAAQLADARRYYTAQPSRYTPAILEQLRSALGLDPAGGVDDALVLAVAEWQSTNGTGEPALVVDGKAGPRTLPRIFRGGLNVAATAEAFGGAVQTGVIDEWATLATAEARRDRLVALVNERLVAAEVPAVTTVFDTNVNNAGSFAFGTWRMAIGRRRLEGDSISEDDARNITDTVYHEARHTEQWFRMAQLRAGQGLSAAAIATELGIPARIATAARALPLARGSMEALIAQGWWDNVYGAGRNRRNAVLRELNASLTARRRASDAHAAAPTPATQAALDRANARFQRAFAAYQNLPEENDAWNTGTLAAPGITGGSPEPGPGPGGGGGGEGGLEGEAGEPAGAPPTLDGPAHGTLPEENLPGEGGA